MTIAHLSLHRCVRTAAHRADVLLVASDSLHVRRVHDRGATTHFVSVLDLSREPAADYSLKGAVQQFSEHLLCDRSEFKISQLFRKALVTSASLVFFYLA